MRKIAPIMFLMSAMGCLDRTPYQTEERSIMTGLDQDITGLILDGDYFYVLGFQGIARFPKGGSTSPQVLYEAQNRRFMAFTTDATHVYWAEDSNSDLDTTPGFVRRIAKDGSGSPEDVASGMHPLGLAVDDTDVFWSTTRSLSNTPTAIQRCVKGQTCDGTTATTLALFTPSQGGGIANAAPAQFAVDGDSVLWVSSTNGAGGTLQVVAKDVSSPATDQVHTSADYQLADPPILLDANAAYWTTREGDRSIRRSLRDQVSNVWTDDTWVIQSDREVGAMAVDSDRLYWVAYTVTANTITARIMAVGKSSHKVEQVVPEGDGRGCVAVDDRYVYWPYGDKLRALPK